MSKRSLTLTDALHQYLLDMSPAEHPVLRALREETAGLPQANMQIAPEQAHFMAALTHLLQARRALEIGVFTGYSALAVALALPADGRLVACDVNAEWTAIAARYWRAAGVADKIELQLRPALATLAALRRAAGPPFDLVFIDADKAGYWAYFEQSLALLRAGGAILVDNVLWSGRVIDPGAQDEDTRAIREFNQRLRADTRVHLCMLPLADGLTLAVKK